MLQSPFTLPKQIHLLLLFLGMWLIGCQSNNSEQSQQKDSLPSSPDSIQTNKAKEKSYIIQSLLGKKLAKPPMPPLLEKRLADSIKVLKERYKKDSSEVNAIWYGRHLAYNYQYEEAFQVYSQALKKYPQSYKLYRHRGHRYISVRKFDQAIADFTQAAKLAKGVQISIEPDGFPNKLNKPLTTTQFNIWYHLGLAHYLKGQYKQAVEAYLECMKFSNNDDTKCSTSDWLYMAYRRNGQKDKAEALLPSINKNMVLIESGAYHQRLLMYKGVIVPDSLLQAEGENIRDQQIKLATQGYGVANWYWYNANKTKAREVFRKVIQTNNWSAFGYIAAEVDLKNMQ